MGDPLVAHLRTCCVQVMGARPGCGFFVTPHLIVTCAHVVGAEVREGAKVGLKHWGEGAVRPLDPATVVAMFPDDDLAFLETGAGHPAFAPLSGEVRLRDMLISLGYPRQDGRETFDQFEASYEGQTQFLDATGRAGVEAKFKAGQVEPGYSGGPLLNLRTGRVMGVVVATRDRRSDLGGWAIDLSVLTTRLAERGIQLPPVDPQWTDAEAKQRAGAAGEGLTLEEIRELIHAESPAHARVEALSRALGQSQSAIRFALQSLGEHAAEIPDEALPVKLMESSQRVEALHRQLALFQSDDPELTARFEAARTALEVESPNPQAAEAAFEGAAELALARAQAAEVWEMKAREIREQRLMEAAEAYAQRGQLALAGLRYLEAARHFQRAAELAPASRAVEAADYRERYADALYRQGDERGDNDALAQSIASYRTLLLSRPRASAALDWATTQNNLGNALARLGEREPGTARLEEAVAAYREALKERTRERVPLDWAMTQNNLGNALRTLGERKKEATLICEALGKQLMAWEVFVIGSPYYARRVENNAKSTMATLNDAFDFSTYEACIAEHAEALKRIGLL